MIKEYLESRFKGGKLYNSWLIQADDTKKALEDLQEFVSQTLLSGELELASNPDFKIVTRQTSATVNTKNISVEQIRNLQEFLNKTSAISGIKIAIIYQADLMNLNSANSCLKILEDTPRNSYIFLITS
jgi:DNA polymerase-3 subunit delta'